jgi:putative Flp pilus-assembly TadE/G-like protein
MTFVMVGVGFLAFMSATMLAIDVGMGMVARTQSQKAADSGALSGAIALVFDNYDDRSPSGPAVQSALTAAKSTQNQVFNAQASVIPEDVTFPTVDQVRVLVQRSVARGNPLTPFIGPMIGIKTMDVGAVATAEIIPANAMQCVKPFMIPDRWIEKNDPPMTMNSTFDMYDNKGNPVPTPDVYIPRGQTGYTGYNPNRDKGTQLILRAGTGNNIEPTMYYSWKMPGNDIGGDFYRENIYMCNQTKVHPGDSMIQEPGNMVGPTTSGIQDLIDQDPAAHWNSSTRKVEGGKAGKSPRIAPIPLYDPAKYANAKKNGRTAEFEVANWIGFFFDRIVGNQVYGYIVPITGTLDKNAGPGSPDAFAKAIVLVE